MALKKIRIGSFVEQVKIKCNIPNLTPDDVSGINKDKEFFEPSKQVGGDTSDYKIVPPGCFACNLMHVGRDVVLPIALNETDKNKIVSPAYTVFKFTDESQILKKYFFMYLKSSEKDRFFWFHTDCSVRDGMDWEIFTNLNLLVPSLGIQQKYVRVYENAMNNCLIYSKGSNDLKLTCDGFIEKLRREDGSEEIGSYIEQISEKNKQAKVKKVLGISKDGFISPNEDPGDLEGYNIFDFNTFVYSPPRINVGSIGLYKEKDKAVCSPIYVCFRSKNEDLLNPDYLLLWLKRKEFLRSTDFYSLASVRNNFSYDLMCKTKINIPSIDKQKLIASVFKEMEARKKYFLRIKNKIFEMCPILVSASLSEGDKSNA